MVLYADLHFHSKYARAVSPRMVLPEIARGAKLKGLGLMGTGDFTHPTWFSDLRNNLIRDSEDEFYELRDPALRTLGIRFMPTVEVATFYSTGGGFSGVKKVHHVIHVASLEEAAQLNDVYRKMGNLAADGRPMFANTSPAQLAEITFEAVPSAEIVAAHAWTPHFGVFGSISGYDSMQEAYEDQCRRVVGIETGMSSDPEMNWRCSFLDSYALMSNSDSHSPTPWRIGREANAFSDDVHNFKQLFKAVRSKDSKKFLFTVEVDPAYGKYHVDGHRACKFSCDPSESKKIKGICPVCHKPLTIGVLNRVEELADRPAGFRPKGAIPFKRILPLHELLGALNHTAVTTKKVQAQAGSLIMDIGSELGVILDAPLEQIASLAGARVAAVIAENRESRLPVKPGFDGEYGVPLLGEDFEKRVARYEKGQKNLGEFN